MARRRFQRGSLILRGKRQRVWVARWWEDVIQVNGKLGRIRRADVLGTLAELPTRRKALQVLSDRLDPVNRGSQKPQSTLSLDQFVEKWEPVILPTLKYSTRKHYQYLLKVHVLPEFGKFQLREITREAIQSFLIGKLQSGLSGKTVTHLRCALSGVLGTAEEWGYVTDNVALKTKLPRREGRPERPVLTVEQIRLLIANLSEPTRSLVQLLVSTGLRVGELLALRWGNVDLDSGLLRITETVYDGHFDKPKTSRSARVIPIAEASIEIFKALRQEGMTSDALVFSNREGKPLDRRNLFSRDIRPVSKRIGLPTISWHCFRHCNATLLDSVGAPLGTVQALLGHASPEITRTIYVHAVPEDQRRAVKSLEELLFGPKRTQVPELVESSSNASS